MTAPKQFTSRFTNRYGEEWVFEYDPGTDEGALRGSDVDWQEYRVVAGRAAGLLLRRGDPVVARNVAGSDERRINAGR